VSFGLPEEVVLLGLDDATGKCVSSYPGLTWNAAVLRELALQNLLDLTGGTVRVRESAYDTGDAILDEAVTSLRQRRRTLSSAIRCHLVERGRDRTLKDLVDHGILEETDNTVLGIFHFRRYPAHDGKVEAAIRARLYELVSGARSPDERSVCLLSLVEGSGLLKSFLTREERRAYQNRIAALTGDEIAGRTLRRVIEEDEAAVTTAVVIAATT